MARKSYILAASSSVLIAPILTVSLLIIFMTYHFFLFLDGPLYFEPLKLFLASSWFFLGRFSSMITRVGLCSYFLMSSRIWFLILTNSSSESTSLRDLRICYSYVIFLLLLLLGKGTGLMIFEFSITFVSGTLSAILSEFMLWGLAWFTWEIKDTFACFSWFSCWMSATLTLPDTWSKVLFPRTVLDR